MCPCGEFISWGSAAGIDVPGAGGATWQSMGAQKETMAKRGCPGVILIWWELQCIPGHSHSVQLFLDLLQKLKKCCTLFHCIKTETAKISSARTSLKKRLKKKGAIKLPKILPTSENSACHHIAANDVTKTMDVVAKIQHYTVRPQIQRGALSNTKIHKSELEELVAPLEEKQGELSHVHRKSDNFWLTWDKHKSFFSIIINNFVFLNASHS